MKFKKTLLFLCGFALLGAVQLWAIIPPETFPYQTDPDRVHYSVKPESRSKDMALKISPKLLKQRIVRSESTPQIEAVSVHFPAKSSQRKRLIKQIARPGKWQTLGKRLISRAEKGKVVLNKGDLPYLSLVKLSKMKAQPHKQVFLRANSLSLDHKDDFLQQLKPFFSAKKMRYFRFLMSQPREFPLHEEMLPKFAEKMVGRYTMYQGPNCFHASLAFHNPKFGESEFFNIKEEKGYHDLMINYDELWRIIRGQFYEINPASSPLKYGDLILFFELPNKRTKDVYFKWIRHATVHLVDGYTFSKGSKSANSPYSVKTFRDEWKLWNGFTKNLGFKVFRRNSNSRDVNLNVDLEEWVY